MADFKTHMTVSTVTGAVLGFAGWKAAMPIDTCVVAGTLCSVSGMLPDLDSNSGRPLREATALGAAVIPMLMVDRLQKMELKQDTMVLIAIIAYVVIRFVLAEIFRRYTVHRGMWHSIPAAAICGMVAFLVMSHEDITIRLFKTSGVVLGFLSHLILDEIWSIDFRKGSYQFKSSFGTALKLWGGSRFANVVTYAKLAIISTLVWQDQGFMSKYHMDPNVPHTMSEMLASLKSRYQKAKDVVEDIGNRIPGLGDDAEQSGQGLAGEQGQAGQAGLGKSNFGQAGLGQSGFGQAGGGAQPQQSPGSFTLPTSTNFGSSSNPPIVPGTGQGFGGNSSPAPSTWK